MFQLSLVDQCKKNSRRAQLKLYKQYCDGMFCVAMRFVKNEDDAEDILQESFVKAFQKIHQYQGDVTFGAWLKRIVINKSIDHLKVKHQNMVRLDESYLQLVDDDDWSVDEGISMEVIKKCIEKLPEKYKYVVMMFLVEGYDHSEIAQVLEISETACRTRLLRGKAYLKETLKVDCYGTGS